MKEYQVVCRIFERGVGEANKEYTLCSNLIKEWDEVDVCETFLDHLLEKLSYNFYFVDPFIAEHTLDAAERFLLYPINNYPIPINPTEHQ